MSETITWLGGVMELKPVEYKIVEKQVEVKRWFGWHSTHTEYYLESEFGSLGPFDTPREIRLAASSAGMCLTN